MRVSRRSFLEAGGFAALGVRVGHALQGAVLNQQGALRIFVDSAPFLEAYQAAGAEEFVDWSGADIGAMNACTKCYAATELRLHIRLLTGEELPIVSPGNADLPGLYILSLDDASVPSLAKAVIAEHKLESRLAISGSFALVPHRGSIFLIGKDRAGALYSAYHFLEMQGIRWYEPGEENTYIPEKTELNIPTGLMIETPMMFSRGFTGPGEVTRDFHTWMARNRLNLWVNEQSGQPWLKKLCLVLMGGGHSAFPRYINPQAEYPYAFPLFPAASGKPKDPYKVDAASYLGDVNHDGKLSYWEAHPEWYGMENGVRHAFQSVEGLNPCTSNDDMLAEVFKGITHDLAAGNMLYVDQYNFWGLDSHRWCQCGPCKAQGTPTDRILIVSDKLRRSLDQAKQRGELKRDVMAVFAMYYETIKPPTRPLPADFDYEKCIGTMFPISRCYGHFIDDPTCTEYNKILWDELTAWSKAFSKGRLLIGEYYNISRCKSLPALDTRTIVHDIPAYYGLGARNMHYMHVSYPHNGPKRWRDYLFAKLLWNTEANANSLFHEYLHNFFGEAAAAPMGELYEHLERAVSPVTSWRGFTPDLVGLLLKNKDPESLEHLKIKETHSAQNDGVDLEESVAHLARCRTIMNGLLHRPLPEPFAGRVREDDMHLQYAENTAGFYYRVAQAVQAKRHGDLETARGFWQRAKVYADRLTQETVVVHTSSRDATAKNALVATELEEYFTQLGNELHAG
ncbi:MAG: DUF4838 domain-containing protein [Acidobacteriaceae bacterium]